ncbi:hypothetical protein N5D61_15890 [Pseudomonas sp. GD03842]|uniref:hypothetical protein n=1 Tax=Pseudomonas sp. GD03842 TaxID=2975385 RepID=UPI00244B6391|nr:hypothetical protein [Pseudomonas sp. GD03842]MDH0747818.1 hypothetical protein [Pseudomonas sp. GD03842]
MIDVILMQEFSRVITRAASFVRSAGSRRRTQRKIELILVATLSGIQRSEALVAHEGMTP